MWPHCTVRLAASLLFLATQAGFCQAIKYVAASDYGTSFGSPSVSVRVFPRANLGNGRDLTYAGLFSYDAKFHPATKLGRFLGVGDSSDDLARIESAPPWMLQPALPVREDYDPPAHAVAVAHPHSPLGDARNAIVTFVYGRRRALQSPYQVTTDSHGRLVVSDPDLPAVHVLDPKGKTSFTILGGGGRRLRLPTGVAVDAEDNIYIADSERGMLLVYDREGRFVRYIGSVHGENWYQQPTGIAIDRNAGRLFVIDTPRNLVFMLDLQGVVLRRLGRGRDGIGAIEFDHPAQIALHGQEVFVLDAGGSRIQIVNQDGDLVGGIRLPKEGARHRNTGGLAVDRDGNIYVSDVAESVIRIYNRGGGLPVSFGRKGSRAGEFSSPTGLWIDEDSRIYVADTDNVRVQLFQLSAEETH